MTRVDETNAERIARVLDIATKAIELRADVWEVAWAGAQSDAENRMAREEIHREVSRLCDELQRISYMSSELGKRMEHLHDVMDRRERPRDSILGAEAGQQE